MNLIMKYLPLLFLFLFTGAGCKRSEHPDLVIAFGSCSNQRVENKMWSPILANQPELFVWGGDIVYSDTEDMERMRKAYDEFKKDSAYSQFAKETKITGTWDDHDYGLNDGGAEWKHKDSVQQILLDFLDVGNDDPRRTRKGVYHKQVIQVGDKTVKILLLDTRYYRSGLTKDPSGQKRYVPNPYGEGTMLGEEQWSWLDQELSDSSTDFNLIVSSIQFLSGEHGFETWANMPHEVDRMISLIRKHKPRGVIFLTGDRHIAEISRMDVKKLPYPLIDFTSSGMTHSYESFSGEPNRYRATEVVSAKNFGLLKFHMKEGRVDLEIRGENNEILESLSQTY